MTNSNPVPEKIGRYDVIRELGRGGMGVVYLARDAFIDRMVAIKTTLVSPFKSEDHAEQHQQMFFNEARAAGKLIHPHIVSVYDAFWEADLCYLVMEYVDGPTLKQHLQEKKLLPLDKVIRLIFQCAKALDYAHQNGIIHRDIKPSNIILSKKGDAKLSDFGIAKIEGATDPPSSGTLTGSVFYMPPETIQDQGASPQADLFSLGVVMYELVAGINPFRSDSDITTIYKITHENPPPLKKYRVDVPDSLESVVARVLEKNPEKRYQSGLQLASDLSGSFDSLRFLDEEIAVEEKFNVLKRLTFFKDFSSGELSEVLKATMWLRYEAGETIITEGEIEECFYIIVSGEVKVIKRGKPLAVLKQGDCFGEMAYLGKTTRTATIEALKRTMLMKVNASVIDQTSMHTQLHFFKVFSTTLIRRLNRTSELLSLG